jgi:hypothetical protein
LWFPRKRYRPGGPPRDPALREAWEFGRSQSQGPPTREDLERWSNFDALENDAYWGGLRARTNEPAAPIAWPLEVVLLAGETAMDLVAHEELVKGVFALPVSFSIQKVRSELERRRAWALRLRADSAPQLRSGWEWIALALARAVYLRVRGRRAVVPTWPEAFAQALICEFDRRQAWRRALSESPR